MFPVFFATCMSRQKIGWKQQQQQLWQQKLRQLQQQQQPQGPLRETSRTVAILQIQAIYYGGCLVVGV